jgi:tetratricopeptide (TPR) repeat protein
MSDSIIELRRDLGDGLPCPLAHSYARLCNSLEGSEPIATTWSLRDAWESAVRLVACLGIADLVNADACSEQLDGALALLFKVSGTSLGDWCSLLKVGCNGEIRTSKPRLLPALNVFYRRASMLTEQGQALSRQSNQGHASDPSALNLVECRNRVFGHGVFQEDRDWYNRQTEAWLKPLLHFYSALQPILSGWVLHEGGPDGPMLMGANTGLETAAHEHVATGEPHPIVLAGPEGLVQFGPLLCTHRCEVCRERHVFFYDKSRRKKDGTLQTELLDYLKGHPTRVEGWPSVRTWADRLPKRLWERGAFEQKELAEGERIVFRSFEVEYLRPDWIMDSLWQTIDEVVTGYVQLEGPGGVGKSYIARALKKEASGERDINVLLYHILAGARTDYRTFISLLADEAKAQLRWRTQEIQAKDRSAQGLKQQFREFLGKLMETNAVSRLVVVLDGLDELPDRVRGEFAIADFLAVADTLPKGCTIILIGRQELRNAIAQHIADLWARSDSTRFRKLTLDPDASENRELLTRYALKRLPAALREPVLAQEVVAKAGGRFLYVFHLVQALATGAFERGQLPAADRLYPAYLERLRARVGDALFEGIYRPVLFCLAAVNSPVTLDQLSSRGLRRDQLNTALYDVADFIEVVRRRPWHQRVDDTDTQHRYRIAHEDFVRYIEGDPRLGLEFEGERQRISDVIRGRRSGQWSDLREDDEDDVFDVSFVASASRRNLSMRAPSSEEIECAIYFIQFGQKLNGAGKLWLALNLLEDSMQIVLAGLKGRGHDPLLFNALAVAKSAMAIALRQLGDLPNSARVSFESVGLFRQLERSLNDPLVAERLATALSRRADTLGLLGRLVEAEADAHEAVGILRRLTAENQDSAEYASSLSVALNSYGIILMRTGRLAEVEGILGESENLERKRTQTHDGRYLSDTLAHILSNRGRILGEMRQLELGATKLKESVAIQRRLISEANRIDLQEALADALDNYAQVLMRLNQPTEAETASSESVEIYRNLVVRDRRTELAVTLADHLNTHGCVLSKLRRLDEVNRIMRESFTLVRPLVEEQKRDDCSKLFSLVLKNYCRILSQLNHVTEAEVKFLEGIRTLRSFERRQAGDSLAPLLNDFSVFLLARDRMEEAELAAQEGFNIIRRLIDEDGRTDLANTLTDILVNYGAILNQRNRPSKWESRSHEVETVCRRLFEMAVQTDEPLALALLSRGAALAELRRLVKAESCVREAVEIYRRLVETEGRDDLAEKLRTATTGLEHLERRLRNRNRGF